MCANPVAVRSSVGTIYPNTTNETIIMLSTRMDGLVDAVENMNLQLSEVRKGLQDINDQLEEMEIRLAIEERDKKIIIGFVAVGLPIILTVLQFLI